MVSLAYDEKEHPTQDHHEYRSDDEKKDVEAAPPTFGIDAKDAPWTITRCIAVASLAMVYVGSQILLYFVSAALTNISDSIGTRYGNWMLTGMSLAVVISSLLTRSSKHVSQSKHGGQRVLLEAFPHPSLLSEIDADLQ